MYDQLILQNGVGATYKFLFVHGYRVAPDGSVDDVTEIVAIYQSADNKVFNVTVYSDEAFEVLRNDLKIVGYRLPGSDTQSAPPLNYIEGQGFLSVPRDSYFYDADGDANFASDD